MNLINSIQRRVIEYQIKKLKNELAKEAVLLKSEAAKIGWATRRKNSTLIHLEN
jgi:hypothetical protein